MDLMLILVYLRPGFWHPCSNLKQKTPYLSSEGGNPNLHVPSEAGPQFLPGFVVGYRTHIYVQTSRRCTAVWPWGSVLCPPNINNTQKYLSQMNINIKSFCRVLIAGVSFCRVKSLWTWHRAKKMTDKNQYSGVKHSIPGVEGDDDENNSM